MRTILLLLLLLSPRMAFAGTVHGTVLVDGPTGTWVKIPDGWVARAELRSQVSKPRYAEVHDGEFTFQNVPEGGGYEISVQPPEGLDCYPVQNICVSPGVVQVELKLGVHGYDEMICVPCRGPLLGRVLAADGKPVKGLPVSVWVGGKEVASTQTNRNGKFRLEDITQHGAVTIQIVREGFPVFRSTFRREPSSAGRVDRVFTLPACTLPSGQPN